MRGVCRDDEEKEHGDTMNGLNRLSDADRAEIESDVKKGIDHALGRVLIRLAVVDSKLDDQKEEVAKQETRLNKVESKVGRIIISVVFALGLLISYAVGLPELLRKLALKVF